MKVPGKGGTPSLIIFQEFTAHGHVPKDHGSCDRCGGRAARSTGPSK